MADEKFDSAALIAEARETDTSGHVRDLLDRLAAALEAVQQTPATSVQEVLDLLDSFHGDNRMSYDAYTNLHDAIAVLAVQQTPAVDREALIDVLNQAEHAPMEDHDPRDGSCRSCPWPVHMLGAEVIADTIRASGILLDAAEVEARGLENFAAIIDDWDSLTFQAASDALGNVIVAARARAQQVREGN